MTDENLSQIEVYLPGGVGTRRRSGVDNRLLLNAILRMADNAARWHDLPEMFVKWTGIHARFRRWSHAGCWQRLLQTMAGTPDFEYVLIDCTISRVHADARGVEGGLKLPPSPGRVPG